MILVNSIKKFVQFGTDFTDDPLSKSMIEKNNFFLLIVCFFLSVIGIKCLVLNDITASLKHYIEVLILIANRLLFRKLKKLSLYSSITAILFTLIVIDVLLSNETGGSGIISIGVLIIAIMYITNGKVGIILSIFMLAFELFIFIFHAKLDWIFTYPDYIKPLFVNFLGVHSGVFVFSYFSIKKQKELYAEISDEKEAKSRLFLNIVHDLKTPLTIIKNSVDQLIHSKNDENQKGILIENISRMEKDVLNILKQARFEKGMIPIDQSSVIDISLLSQQICNAFKEYGNSRGIKISAKISQNIFAKIDQTSYTKVLNNLLENAIKYTADEGRISVDLKTSKSNAVLIVSDTGIGISKKDMEKIFDSYYQANRSYESYYGLGLGLSLTHDICKSWGGDISVESTLDKGSAFKVSLPLGEPIQYNDQKEKGFEINPIPPYKPMPIEVSEHRQDLQNLLLVEDNVEIQNVLIQLFNNSYNLYVASNGKEALDLFNKYSSIDLVITDLMMPVMDGEELIEKIRESEGELKTPIIILTANSNYEDLLNHLSLGAIDYINKPFSSNELFAKTESILKVFKNRQDTLLEKVRSDLMDYLAKGVPIPSQSVSEKEINYQNLRNYGITEKEQVMIEYIFNGLSYKEIAYEEKISINTVKTHIYRIYKKCKINNYASLIKLFY